MHVEEKIYLFIFNLLFSFMVGVTPRSGRNWVRCWISGNVLNIQI